MELVKLMAGTLHVESHLDTGSIFYLTLPKKEILGTISTTDALEMQEEVLITEGVGFRLSDVGEKPISDLGNPTLTLLIVEDNAALRAYLTLVLKPKYLILTAENGQAALKLLNESTNAPDLILSDVMMPIMDGFQLLTALKTNATFCAIPVVMLTARTEMQDKLKALRIGVDDYLTKPFEEEELLARIENLLKNAKVRQQIRQEAFVTGSENFESSPNLTDIPNVIAKNEATSSDIEHPLSIDDLKWLSDLENVLRDNIGDYNLSTDRMADMLYISRSQFYRRVRTLTGLTPIEYLQEIRFNHARLLLEQRTVSSVKAAAAAVGMRQVQNFSQHFKERFGKLPSEYLS